MEPGARFCNTCGAPAAAPAPVAPPAERTCPSCGAQVGADTRFCGSCGAPIAGGASVEPPVAPPPPPPSYQPVMAGAGGPAVPAAPPAKKGHGCLIAAIVVAVLGLLALCCIGVVIWLNSVSGGLGEFSSQFGALIVALGQLL